MSRTFGIPVTEVLASLRASLDSLAGAHPGQLLDTDLTTAVSEIETLSRRLAGAQLAVIAEGISRGLPFATGAGPPPATASQPTKTPNTSSAR